MTVFNTVRNVAGDVLKVRYFTPSGRHIREIRPHFLKGDTEAGNAALQKLREELPQKLYDKVFDGVANSVEGR